ncbi:HEXXH motif domain-containing protein [Streptomyces cellostaticus]|uniref:HEXXH motif domain-containing protein n=1 Tax=Streptomyces cellostaticus TaxID=67285 RepID=UPI00131D032E|nr:HEXXH motif domain-containing protein [Streptomyces cellostaticus]
MSSTPDDRSACHSISAVGLDGLLRGDGDGAVVDELLGAERSRRLLLLRALFDCSIGVASGSGDFPVSLHDAWETLERAQVKAPGVVEEVLMAPGTGTWVSSALRRLRGTLHSDIPLWATLGHLASLAAAAAAAARIEFTLRVPACKGTVFLPGLGCAVLPAQEDWTTARVAGDQWSVRITGGGGEVVVGPDWERQAPGWRPTRRLTLGQGAAAGSVALEEHDPYRTFSGPTAPHVLSESEARSWQCSLAEAWHILLRDAPAHADAMRRGLMSMTPMPRGERFRPYSSSSAEAFGGINASLPDEDSELAATLVHEFQHVKLGALMHLSPLVRRAEKTHERPELFHAPWRDDPRPLEGVLQGIYAFLGVTRFWRANRRAADAAHAPSAHFEFALWREAVWSTLSSVRGHERLTPLGHRLLESLVQSCAGWLGDDVPDAELRLAREAAAGHRARWREHHLRPSPDLVDEAVRAWRRGESCPPLAHTASSVVPDSDAHFLDTAAVLARHRLTDPDGSWRDPVATGDRVRGAGPVDILLARGERSAARRELADQLLYGDPPVGSWAALGRALADRPEHRAASRFLTRSPEWARALRETLHEEHGQRPDPLALAAWLGVATSRPGPFD